MENIGVKVSGEKLTSENVTELANAIVRMASCSPFESVCNQALSVFGDIAEGAVSASHHVMFNSSVITVGDKPGEQLLTDLPTENDQ